MTETPLPVTDTVRADAPPQPGRRSSLIRSSFIFSGLTLVSRLVGFVRDLAIAAKLGASQTIAADAYYTALAFPNLFRRIFAEGAFAAAFVPSYSRKLAADGEAEAGRYAADALATVAAATVALTVACQLAMPWLMYVINPGFVDDPAKFKLAIVLTQITMPYLPCMAIAALFSGVLNAHGRFIVSGFYPTILNLVMLAAVLPQDNPVEAAYAASFGVIVAGVGQAALCWWGARRAGGRVRLVLPRFTPEMKRLIRLAVPTAIANSATQINIFISGILASQVAGMRTWLNFADRLYQLPYALIGVAIGVALLPKLASALQKGDQADAQDALDQGLVFGLAFSLPAAAALMAMPYYLIDGLFTRGEFVRADALATAQLLFHYAWGVPAFVLLRILQPAFFARQDTKTPMRVSLISVAVNIALGVTLFYTVGFWGIAAATSAAAWISIVQLWLALRRGGLYRPSGRNLFRIGRVAAASLALGALLALANHYRPVLEAPFAGLDLAGVGAKEIMVVLLSLAGLALYPALLFSFGGVTPAEARAMLRRRRGDPPPADLP